MGDQASRNWEEREWRFEIRERHPPKPPEVETSGNISSNISVRCGAEAGDTRKSRGASAREGRDWNFWKKNWNEWCPRTMKGRGGSGWGFGVFVACNEGER
jgi:hypothetical protein